MRVYEKDHVRLPWIFSWMSVAQLQKFSDIIYKFSKHTPQRKRIPNPNIKFYI